jgi:tyrosyl-tRNA synthetase
MLAGLVSSASEGQRKLKEGAVYINGEQQRGHVVSLGDTPELLLKLGKKIKRIKMV